MSDSTPKQGLRAPWTGEWNADEKRRILESAQGMSMAEIFAFAIAREREAQQFYRAAGALLTAPGADAMLADLYREEVRHEQLLEQARLDRRIEPVGKPRGYADLGLAELLSPVDLDAAGTVQDVLIAAIKEEAFSAAFYRAVADQVEKEETKNFFQRLSYEETQHQRQLETWYDDHILTDN